MGPYFLAAIHLLAVVRIPRTSVESTNGHITSQRGSSNTCCKFLTAWLAIPAATGLVLLPAFLPQPVLETHLLISFSAKICPHSMYVLVSSHHFRLLLRELSPLPICQWFFSPCMIPHLPISPPTHKLPEAESFFAALIATKYHFLWNADRTRNETQFFHFLLILARCVSHVILRLFGFYPNYFSLRTLDFFTFLSLHATLTSVILVLSPLVST